MLRAPSGWTPRHVVQMVVHYEQRPGQPRIAAKALPIQADGLPHMPHFAQESDAVSAARRLSAADHQAHLVLRERDGSFAIWGACVDAEAGWFLLSPRWMHTMGIRSLTFTQFDPNVVAVVDADHVVANPLSQIG